MRHRRSNRSPGEHKKKNHQRNDFHFLSLFFHARGGRISSGEHLLRADRREFHVGAGFMEHQPATRDRNVEAGFVFGRRSLERVQLSDEEKQIATIRSRGGLYTGMEIDRLYSAL
jgi:hypothetical protein